jgi:KR domain
MRRWQDTLFSRLTASQVRTAVWPKVHGTVNLHELLPKNLDFFVMLSSLAGVIGNREQGNYGCGK